MIRSRGFARVAVFVLGTLWPALSHACPVCFSGSPRIRAAFFGTTILLSLLPLGMIAGGLMWLHRNGRLSFADEFVERDEVPRVATVEADPARDEQATPARVAPHPA